MAAPIFLVRRMSLHHSQRIFRDGLVVGTGIPPHPALPKGRWKYTHAAVPGGATQVNPAPGTAQGANLLVVSNGDLAVVSRRGRALCTSIWALRRGASQRPTPSRGA
ncbi:MAG TPA: hypothetical protein VK249_29100 [Anaerolineales bacterium]|nr:hypothetical protein [Anaerolineales bacterium]